MRRRRLIGVYRGFVKSMVLPWLHFRMSRSAAAKAGARLNCAAPPQRKSYPKAERSTIDIDLHAHNRNAIVAGECPLP
jgi:hypothetical protein